MQIETSKGTQNVAGGGTTALGVIGTTLGGLALAGGNANGLLGNVFGGFGGAANSALVSEIAQLKAEKYTDEKSLEDRDRIAALNDKVIGYVIDIDKRLSTVEATGPLREQILAQKIECCCNSANTAISALAQTVANITKTVVPNSSVCPGWGNVTITPAAAPTTVAG
jgi:hypothetical protein